jgi:hypothetical protein
LPLGCSYISFEQNEEDICSILYTLYLFIQRDLDSNLSTVTQCQPHLNVLQHKRDQHFFSGILFTRKTKILQPSQKRVAFILIPQNLATLAVVQPINLGNSIPVYYPGTLYCLFRKKV